MEWVNVCGQIESPVVSVAVCCSIECIHHTDELN